MIEEDLTIQCPYCFELVEVWLEPDVEGALVMDCEVCCNPWQLVIARDEDGALSVDVRRAQ